MKGQVQKINHKHKMVAIRTEKATWSVLDLSDQFDLGLEDAHILQWDRADQLGRLTVKNLTSAKDISGYFQNHNADEKDLHKLMLLDK